MRNIHSIKGALGMIGKESEMQIVHELESLLQRSFVEGDLPLEFVEFFVGPWDQLEDCLNQEVPMSVSVNEIKRFNFKTAEHSRHVKNVKPKTENPFHGKLCYDGLGIDLKIDTPVVLLGDNSSAEAILKYLGLGFVKYNCVNEVYRHHKLLENVKFVIFDLSQLRVNPFMLQKNILKLKRNIKFLYLVEDFGDLHQRLEEFKQDSLHFSVFHKGSDKLKLLEYLRAELTV